VRHILDDFGLGLALAPQRSERSLARITVALTDATAGALAGAFANHALENLRTGIPAARSLPLLQAIAKGESTTLVLDYLDACRIAVEVAPCS
jgi:hypothetical protein